MRIPNCPIDLLKEPNYVETSPGSFGKALLVQAEDGTKLVCKAVDVSAASSKETQEREEREERREKDRESSKRESGWEGVQCVQMKMVDALMH